MTDHEFNQELIKFKSFCVEKGRLPSQDAESAEERKMFMFMDAHRKRDINTVKKQTTKNRILAVQEVVSEYAGKAMKVYAYERALKEMNEFYTKFERIPYSKNGGEEALLRSRATDAGIFIKDEFFHNICIKEFITDFLTEKEILNIILSYCQTYGYPKSQGDDFSRKLFYYCKSQIEKGNKSIISLKKRFSKQSIIEIAEAWGEEHNWQKPKYNGTDVERKIMILISNCISPMCSNLMSEERRKKALELRKKFGYSETAERPNPRKGQKLIDLNPVQRVTKWLDENNWRKPSYLTKGEERAVYNILTIQYKLFEGTEYYDDLTNIRAKLGIVPCGKHTMQFKLERAKKWLEQNNWRKPKFGGDSEEKAVERIFSLLRQPKEVQEKEASPEELEELRNLFEKTVDCKITGTAEEQKTPKVEHEEKPTKRSNKSLQPRELKTAELLLTYFKEEMRDDIRISLITTSIFLEQLSLVISNNPNIDFWHRRKGALTRLGRGLLTYKSYYQNTANVVDLINHIFRIKQGS